MHERLRRFSRTSVGKVVQKTPVVSKAFLWAYQTIRDHERESHIHRNNDGYVLDLPDISNAKMSRGDPPIAGEIRFVKYVCENVDRNSVVIDVGAHIGHHTVPYGHYFSKVIALEPVPANTLLLRENVEENELDVEIKGVVATDTTEPAMIFADDDVAERAGLADHPDRKPIKVPGVTIDSLKPNPDAIKVDVEGAEQLVLEGASDVLTTSKPDVFVEVHRTKMEEFGHSPETLSQFMAKFDYSARKIIESGPERDWTHFYPENAS